MKRLLLSLVIAAMFVFTIQFAAAAVPGGATISNWENKTEWGGPGAVGSQPVTSGHIYHGDLDTTQLTYRWAGVFGNTTGQIVLRDGSGNTFYTWSNANGKVVYVTTSNSPTWSSLTAATISTINTQASWINQANTADSYNNTFDDGTGSLPSNIFSVSAPTATVGSWTNYALEDGTNLIWAVGVTTAAAYNGTTYEYEVLIPENGTGGDTSATTYYFYVELV